MGKKIFFFNLLCVIENVIKRTLLYFSLKLYTKKQSGTLRTAFNTRISILRK